MISPSANAYFWDVDPRNLDTRKHERFIISRLLNYGGLEEWRWLAEAETSEDRLRCIIGVVFNPGI